MAFSFGPFIGFWSAHQACIDRGALVIPGGGLTSLARLEFIRQSQANVVCCTPSYALHLADVAAAENIPLPALKIERMIVAGEAGGSVPGVRNKIESAWGARVIDHSGATEIGPWGFGWPDRCGLHLIETNFIAEFLPLARGPGEHNPRSTDLAELVITSLGRYGAPIFRYRTGDVVRHEYINDERVGCNFVWLPDGVVGRADDMVTIRGVNVFPSSIDAIVREVPGISEYRIIVSRRGELDQLQVEIEADEATQHQLEKNLASRLGLRIPVALAPLASLPRSELKSRRWIDQRFND
jgi:phenylacetate-CoA ligase